MKREVDSERGRSFRDTFRVRGRCVLGKGRSFEDDGMKEIHFGDRMMGKNAKVFGKGDNKEGEKFWG